KRGRSFLTVNGNSLYQAPVSWYADRQEWDLSPHLAGVPDHLNRPVQPLCLFCHSNHFEYVEHSANLYKKPFFQGHAIGCERCHGPGELHDLARVKGSKFEGYDDTIVNPRRLSATLRDAVCEQCHLQGAARVLRNGKKIFDFRPGLPLQD